EVLVDDLERLEADGDDVAVREQRRPLDAALVDEHAVAAAEILDHQAVLAVDEARVMARYEAAFELESAIGRAADDERLGPDLVLLARGAHREPARLRRLRTGLGSSGTALRRRSVQSGRS